MAPRSSHARGARLLLAFWARYRGPTRRHRLSIKLQPPGTNVSRSLESRIFGGADPTNASDRQAFGRSGLDA